MKKITLIFLSLILIVSVIAPVISAQSEIKEPIIPMIDERITGILESNNIDYAVSDGTIIISDKSETNRNRVNQLLIASFRTDVNLQSAMATYPSAWQSLKNYNFAGSKKFSGATKTAFVAAFTAYAKNIATPWKELVAVAAGGYAAYYFINNNTEDLYTFITYHYRTMGPGFVDSNGTVYGDYEIRKQTRITKNSNNTGGAYDVDTRRGTSLVPWF